MELPAPIPAGPPIPAASPVGSGKLVVALVAALVLGAAIYFFTRPKAKKVEIV